MKRVVKGFLKVLLGLGAFALLSYGYFRLHVPPPDGEIERLLVGKWYEEYREWHGKDWRGGEATTTYKADGTFEAAATRGRKGAGGTKYVASGTWRVKDRTIIETVETCDPPLLTKGQVFKDWVLLIDGLGLRVQDAEGDTDGESYMKTRVPD
jgi:hypothetical protein